MVLTGAYTNKWSEASSSIVFVLLIVFELLAITKSIKVDVVLVILVGKSIDYRLVKMLEYIMKSLTHY